MKTANTKLNSDSDYLTCFVKQEIDERWIKSISNSVAPWVKLKGKSYWDVVLFACVQKGILNNISRIKFARLVLQLCPEVFEKDETAEKIGAAMEKCPHTSQKKKENYGSPVGDRILKDLVEDVSRLFEREDETVIGTRELLPESLYTFLEKSVRKNSNQRLFRNKEYEAGIRPEISIEHYATQRFMDEEKYSSIDAFVFFEQRVTPDEINMLFGRYRNMKNTKIVIVSTKPLCKESRKLCDENGYGFIFIERGKPITEKSRILPRSVGDIVRQRLDIQIIDGHRPMDTPVLIYDQSKCTSSLPEWLTWNNVEVSPRYSANIPFRTNEEIEELANSYSGVFTLGDAMDRFNNGCVAIDVFAIAKEKSISYTWDVLPDDQLGRIDLDSRHITLDISLIDKKERARFTVGHEMGHDAMHSNLPGQLESIESFGDNSVFFDSTSTLKNVFERCEIQANMFAASLLMPRFLVVYLYSYYYNLKITQVFGDSFSTLYWDENNPVAIQNCMRVISPMAYSLQVSVSAMKWRLKNMGLLREGLSTLHYSRKSRLFKV